MATPREHIEHLRKTWFSIGGDVNPLASMLDQAVKYLSTELYTKDVHFLMELIQNAEDNEYPDGVDPSLEFVLTSRDITATGAPATLLLFNNEKGFSAKNIESLCNVGNSTKKGQRKSGYIGEKGIGFKSVFLITAQPYIFSNGYQIRFNEEPCPPCNLGYIVPEWIDEKPSLLDIKQIYGSGRTIPNTTIIFPLKPDKVKPVTQQLSSIHPEILLFLGKIKSLSIREDHENPNHNSLSAIAITKETNFVTRKNIDALSYTLHLSADENNDHIERECSYYMWKQRFPVKEENRVERRMEVEDWVITLAFPNGDRLHGGMSSPGVYAFLPTEMITNFPFIIQADFILVSSRETIRLDSIWNQGILDCVPSAFVNALISLVKTTEDAPVSSLPQMFNFLPVKSSPYPQLDALRKSIKEKLDEENIIPIESYMEQKFFCKPREVRRILPAFWSILHQARVQGVSLHNLSSHGCYILNSSFDTAEYDEILDFLGVERVNIEWYASCIEGSNLVTGISEQTYLGLLLFLVDNWGAICGNSKMKNIPILKYIDLDGSVSLCSIIETTHLSCKKTLCVSHSFGNISWLIDWHKEFRCMAKHFFLPRSTQEAIMLSSRKEALVGWLRNQAGVNSFTLFDYAALLIKHLNYDNKLVNAYTHFLYHSVSRELLSQSEVDYLFRNLPLIDNYGHITSVRNGVLVPANGSKWVKLIASNPWRSQGFVELGESYLKPASFAGCSTTGEQLLKFLKDHIEVADVPYVRPPNSEIPSVSAPLTKQNVFLLLQWIRNLMLQRSPFPQKFLASIKEGSWLRTTMKHISGYRPPSQSFMLTSSAADSNWGSILQNASLLVDVPLIDVEFYGDEIIGYKEELKIVGIMTEYGEACKFIGDHLMSLAASLTLTKSNVMTMLNFIRMLRQNFLPPENFISSIRGGDWLRTSCGKRSPVGSVLYNHEWESARQISNIPFVDESFYGEEILDFKTELQLLGVVVDFGGCYPVVVNHLKHPSSLSNLTADALLLALECMRQLPFSDRISRALVNAECFKTSLGYKNPYECFLSDPGWSCLFEVFSELPIVETDAYGVDVFSFKVELKKLGVKVDFEDAINAFTSVFRRYASRSSLTKEKTLLFLSCFRQLRKSNLKFPLDLKKCIRDEKWLRTRLGDYRSPRKCILFGPEWELISPITCLPFLNDSENHYGKGIHEYKEELGSMGVVTDLKNGAEFVVDNLLFLSYYRCITPSNVRALLECISLLLKNTDYSFPSAFLEKTSGPWLKTYAGYMAPDRCCLFDSKWDSIVKRTDGPFIDEEFYGFNISLFRKELGAIGVGVDAKYACSLLASHLESFSDFAAIVRIYNFLREYKWEPDGEAASTIWIPDGCNNGNWVNPGDCVLHDSAELFNVRLHVLENHYEPKLLIFFSKAFKVRSDPSFDDYCKLWKEWESCGRQLTDSECCTFWKYFMRLMSLSSLSQTQDLLKLPVVLRSGGILLADKTDVFIADDLQLMDLFQEFSPHPLFVWYPQPSLPSLPRSELLEAYRKLGVRTISKIVQKEELSLSDGVDAEQVNLRDSLIGKGLVRSILSFLAGPLNMEAQKRHETVQCLLNLTIMETLEPFTLCYSLSLTSGEVVTVRASQMVRWDRESSTLFTHKMGSTGGRKNVISFATCFAEEIAKGVLWDKEDHVDVLTELIKLVCLLEFDDEAVQFLMKSKNLEIFMEDEDLLSATFPSD
ncbi:hypothetical protein K2173_027642 [Erythroxylum novogranatense]|uniref:Sacsin/Nov domain-containing protein n=1 Tax=Erythroxylum novogranatense TaxID=1862640 RepID=A0AAV8TZS8_9ROSI|nr:hypothetical protein K2173_027642 [Erythroxylum novogranatense]